MADTTGEGLIYLLVTTEGQLLGIFQSREEAQLRSDNSPAHCVIHAVGTHDEEVEAALTKHIMEQMFSGLKASDGD